MAMAVDVASCLADVTRRQLGWVNAVGQRLRDADMLPKGTRGRSADLSLSDIVTWTLAALGTDTISVAPKAAAYGVNLRVKSDHGTPMELKARREAPDLAKRFTFQRKDFAGEAIGALLSDIRRGALDLTPEEKKRGHWRDARVTVQRGQHIFISASEFWFESGAKGKKFQRQSAGFECEYTPNFVEGSSYHDSASGELVTVLKLHPEPPSEEIGADFDVSYQAVLHRSGLLKIAALLPEAIEQEKLK